ncbi:unnamed protein product [Spodoptera littoralis]|uniref:Uncharacterized protein n=1 Tax=Spodoptera littoralis TaxID=7109 RepID=A0A9P0I1V1_SPOLI|nr:unnamed protein product [Spodoptera littoralis]CAH1638622.1 unnamed protein product [Spodoptera littoralis]
MSFVPMSSASVCLLSPFHTLWRMYRHRRRKFDCSFLVMKSNWDGNLNFIIVYCGCDHVSACKSINMGSYRYWQILYLMAGPNWWRVVVLYVKLLRSRYATLKVGPRFN